MPVDKEYCTKTPISKMGFSQRSTCKALGIISRTGKTNAGQFIVSDKYKGSRNRLRSRRSRSKSRKRSRSILGSRNRLRSRGKITTLTKTTQKSCGCN